MNTPDKMKPGTLVKYLPSRASSSRAHRRAGAAYCRWNLKRAWDEIETKLVGIVLKNLENDRLQIRWFGINETFDHEYERYLERVG